MLHGLRTDADGSPEHDRRGDPAEAGGMRGGDPEDSERCEQCDVRRELDPRVARPCGDPERADSVEDGLEPHEAALAVDVRRPEQHDRERSGVNRGGRDEPPAPIPHVHPSTLPGRGSVDITSRRRTDHARLTARASAPARDVQLSRVCNAGLMNAG